MYANTIQNQLITINNGVINLKDEKWSLLFWPGIFRRTPDFVGELTYT